jgi:hypothetical protein
MGLLGKPGPPLAVADEPGGFERKAMIHYVQPWDRPLRQRTLYGPAESGVCQEPDVVVAGHQAGGVPTDARLGTPAG